MRSYGALAAIAALAMGTAGAAANGEDRRHPPAGDGFGYGVYEYHDWAGIYAGVQGGWIWGDDDAFESFTNGGFLSDGPLPYDTDGYVAGGVLGINMQVGHWVYGGEIDVEYADISGEWDWGNDNGLTKDIDLTGSLRLRTGFALDRFFLYGTGGLAVGRVHMVTIDGPPPLITIEGEETEFGWTAGGGLEVEIWNGFSVGAEYRYTDLGETEHDGDIFGNDFTYSHTNRFHAVRARLIYRMHI